jgi:hypothetical protein
MSASDTAIIFMGSTEAREKSLKLLTNIARIAHTYTGVAQHKDLAKSLSAGRSLLRIAQHGNQMTAMRELVARGELSKLAPQLTFVRYIFELGFLTFNNIALFSKWKLLNANAALNDYRGTVCLVMVYLIASVVDLLKMSSAGFHRFDLKDAQWRKLLLDLTRHLADAVCSLSSTGWSRSLTVSDRTLGVLGAFSGFAACYINWDAAAKTAVAKKDKQF